MIRYIISDTHLGHKNVHKYRQRFSTAEEHHQLVWNNIKAIDNKRNMLFLLGDIAFDFEWLQRVADLKCRTILVCGNHDLEHGIKMSDVVEAYDDVYSLYKKSDFWLAHCPIHQEELRGKGCIHGHTHNHLIEHPMYRNVCCEYTGYKPALWEDVVAPNYYTNCLKLRDGGNV